MPYSDYRYFIWCEKLTFSWWTLVGHLYIFQNWWSMAQWGWVVITILLKNHTRSLLQRRFTYVVISSILFRKFDPFDFFSLGHTCMCKMYFLRSPKQNKKGMKMAIGGWEFKFVFKLVFCYWWRSDNNVCIHIEQLPFPTEFIGTN